MSQIGRQQGPFPLWEDVRGAVRWGQGSKLSLDMDPLRCLFEIQVENYRFRCAAERATFNSPLLMDIWAVSSSHWYRQCHRLGLWIRGCVPEGCIPSSWKHWVKGCGCFLSFDCQMAVQKGSTNLYFHQKCTRMSGFLRSCQQWGLSVFLKSLPIQKAKKALIVFT